MTGTEPRAVTALLRGWRDGNAAALEQLVPLVHHELRLIARRHIRRERPGHSLQATALVNEAYLRLVDIDRADFRDRCHFFAMAARVMRRVLVDHARARLSHKRGGGAIRVTLADGILADGTGPDLVALDDALNALGHVDERKSRGVELRFFGGLSVQETAEILNVSTDTVTRDWNFAKRWLRRELQKPGGSS
jgi:RNA polymerase sigma-70 factor, ECF subfamily